MSGVEKTCESFPWGFLESQGRCNLVTRCNCRGQGIPVYMAFQKRPLLKNTPKFNRQRVFPWKVTKSYPRGKPKSSGTFQACFQGLYVQLLPEGRDLLHQHFQGTIYFSGLWLKRGKVSSSSRPPKFRLGGIRLKCHRKFWRDQTSQQIYLVSSVGTFPSKSGSSSSSSSNNCGWQEKYVGEQKPIKIYQVLGIVPEKPEQPSQIWWGFNVL